MTRPIHAAAAVLVMLALSVGVLIAQAAFVPPLKGDAEVQILPIKPVPDYKAKLLNTVIEVKNISPTGSIVGLKVEQYWWDKANSPQPVSMATKRLKAPLKPGETAKIELQLPLDPKMFRDTYMFSHTNGKIKIKQVTKF